MKQLLVRTASLLCLVFSSILIMASCSKTDKEVALDFNKAQWVDLSHAYDKNTLYWPNNKKGFEHEADFVGQTPGHYFYSSYSLSTPEHGGTHLDAPIHFEKGLTLDQIPLSSLTGYAVVIEVKRQVRARPDYLISIEDVLDWEKSHATIKPNTIILFNTGYGNYYPHRKEYFGTDKKGVEAIAELHFPGIDPKLSEWLVKERSPKAVGIDTASIDYGQSKDFQTHRILLGSNIPGFENLANLDQLPATGAYVIALPMKIKDGSGGSLRVIAGISTK